MIDISVKVNGGLFSKDIGKTVRRAMYEESLQKIATRMERGGKGLGSKRNTVSSHPNGELEVKVSSTRIYPRTKGTSWQGKNIGIAKAMSGRVLRKAAERIVSEMGA